MDILLDSTGALPVAGEHRNNLRKTSKTTRRRTTSHRVRLAAKQYAAQHRGLSPHDLIRAVGIPNYWQEYNGTAGPIPEKRHDPGASRLHLEKTLFQYKAQENIAIGDGSRNAGRFYHGQRTGRLTPKVFDKESVALARSRIALPSDRHRSSMVRQPSLEREDAFCDASTLRGKVRVQRAAPAMPVDDDAQVAELYRMGLLYDDGDNCSSRQGSQGDHFDLNAIQHEEPVYTIRAPRRSGRKHGKARGHDQPLDLDLSFADLGHDDEIAQYLVSSPDSQSSAGDEAVQHSPRRHHSRQSSAPIRVIYELTSSRPSFDLDTSQPPDLVTDSLSEYDCFSDSDLDDDVPSQEVDDIEPATSASGPWVMLGDGS